jgi:type II secretory pathway pseudopilin PulG
MKSTPITLLYFSLLLLSANACRQTAEKAQEQAIESAIESQSGGKADVEVNEGNINIESDEGSFSMKTGAKTWPSDIPASVTQPTGGAIAGVMTTETDEGNSWTVQYTGIPVTELDRYRDDLKAKGFQTGIMKTDEGGMVTGQKDKLSIMLQLGGDGGVLTVVEEKK